MKKKILGVTLVVVGSFTGGLAISKYHKSSPTTINYILTEYNEDGTTASTSRIVRVSNINIDGEWSQTQVLPNGRLTTASGKVQPDRVVKIPSDSPTAEILGRPVVILSDRRSDAWYDPELRDFLKEILYTDDSRQTVSAVNEAVEIKN